MCREGGFTQREETKPGTQASVLPCRCLRALTTARGLVDRSMPVLSCAQYSIPLCNPPRCQRRRVLGTEVQKIFSCGKLYLLNICSFNKLFSCMCGERHACRCVHACRDQMIVLQSSLQKSMYFIYLCFVCGGGVCGTKCFCGCMNMCMQGYMNVYAPVHDSDEGICKQTQ